LVISNKISNKKRPPGIKGGLFFKGRDNFILVLPDVTKIQKKLKI